MLYKYNGEDAVSIKKYGVKGDGVTDDSDLINYALSAERNVYIPQGTYLVSKTIVIPNNTNVYGDGNLSVFKLADTFELTGYAWRNDFKYPVIRVGANCILRDFFVNGDETKCRDMGMVGIWIAGDNSVCENVSTKNINYFPSDWIGGTQGYGTVNAPGYALFISDCDNVDVNGGTFNGNGYEGIGTENANNVMIHGCRVGDGNRTGIQIHRYSKHVVVSNCTVNNSNANKHADLTIHGTDDDFIDDIKIIGCSFVNACEEKASIQTVDGYEKSIIIEGCNFTSNNCCVSIGHDRTTGDETANRIVIADNIMKSNLDGVYIRGNICNVIGNVIDCNGQAIMITGNQKATEPNLILT